MEKQIIKIDFHLFIVFCGLLRAYINALLITQRIIFDILDKKLLV